MGRRTFTPEQRQEREQADKQLREQARELLADPDAVAAMVEQLITVSRSPKVLRYSLRNQAILTKQVEARGMTLTDVDSFRGWLERGRCVRKGEKALRVVAPKGREGGESDEEAEAGETTPAQGGEQTGDGEAEGRVRFRMVTVFDISQTEGVEDVDVVGEAFEVPNPAALLRDTLTEQIERRGYEIEETAEADGAAAVDDGDLVTVPSGRPVQELARALAVILHSEKTNRAPSSVRA